MILSEVQKIGREGSPEEPMIREREKEILLRAKGSGEREKEVIPRELKSIEREKEILPDY